MIDLRQADIELHAKLGIPVDLRGRAGVRRVDDREARDLLGVRNHHGDLSGVLYPRINPATGREVGYRIRRDHPEIENGRPKAKYLSSIDRAHLYFAPDTDVLLNDVATTAIFGESEKFVLAITDAARRAGRRVLAVGTGGCWGWKGRIGKT